jgi:putative Holliday junction resolvase
MTEQRGRTLAIDYGSKRVGLAISDPLGIIAQGVGTVENDETLTTRISDLVRKRDVVAVVVGIPYGPDGGKGAKAIEVEDFIAKLRNELAVDIQTWDESYSSVNAQRTFIEAGMKRKKRQQKHRVDEMAARLMLQEYLDHHSH